MDNSAITFIERSQEITGYRVKTTKKPAFQVTGYTIICPPEGEGPIIKDFVAAVMTDGRMETLKKASAVPPWILGLGSWDEECQPRGMRYTMGIEENQHTELSGLLRQYPIHSQSFEACEWMCFEVPQERFDTDQFWNDDPYKMLRDLGYRFHLRVGVHFDAYPPDHDERTKPGMEFWISVMEQGNEECDICSVREGCAQIQPFD
jgi:hypothetical protein